MRRTWLGCEITDTPDLFMQIPDSEKWPIVADSARPETISHMRRNGFPKIMSAVKGPKSVEEGIEWLKSYDIVVHPSAVRSHNRRADAVFLQDRPINQSGAADS
jgi:phage terminase large subunit